MNQNARLVIWYSAIAIFLYLVLTNWRGANALLGTGFGGARGYVEALQGRSRPR